MFTPIFPYFLSNLFGFVCHVTCGPTTCLQGLFSVPETSPPSVRGTIRLLHHHRLWIVVALGSTSHGIPNEWCTCVSDGVCFAVMMIGLCSNDTVKTMLFAVHPKEISDCLVLVHIFAVGGMCFLINSPATVGDS